MKYNISFRVYLLKTYLNPELYWNINFLWDYFVKKSPKTIKANIHIVIEQLFE